MILPIVLAVSRHREPEVQFPEIRPVILEKTRRSFEGAAHLFLEYMWVLLSYERFGVMIRVSRLGLG